MPRRALHDLLAAPTAKRMLWARVRCIRPRQNLCVLPTHTRPNLFGGD